LLVWPVLMTYPHRLTYGRLPLNAGFDDLFILFTAFAWLVFGQKASAGLALWCLLALSSIVFAAEATGFVLSGGTMGASMLRNLLKWTVKITFGWVMVTSISTKSNASLLIGSYALAMTGAAALALADWARLPGADWFYVLKSEEQEILRYRATGPFMGPGSAGTNLGMATILLGHFVASRVSAWIRLASLGCCVVTFGTMIASGSRSAFFAFGMVALTMILLSRHRLIVIICLALAGAMFMSLPTYRSAVTDMLERTTAQLDTENVESGGTGRQANIIYSMRSSGGPQTLLFGVGETQFAARGAYAHNGYLSWLLSFGLVGLIWLGYWTSQMMLRCRKALATKPDGFVDGFCTAVPWIIVFLVFANLTFDCTLNTFWQFQILFLGAICFQIPSLLKTDSQKAGYRPVGLAVVRDRFRPFP
ncbi:MAG: O-antigen ligase family protein, partial [Planctomycetota bacterium]